MGEAELLKLIGRQGNYGSAIPDDDATLATLTDCTLRGLLSSEPSRMDDYFFLTSKGKRALRELEAEGTSR
jgi:hypothetical protein